MSLQILQARVCLIAVFKLEGKKHYCRSLCILIIFALFFVNYTLYVFSLSYRASVRFFPRVPPHVHNEHVLGLEGLLLPGAVVPLADEMLLVRPDVVRVDVLWIETTIKHFIHKGIQCRG